MTFNEKRNMKAFTFDFKSLYDNLKPALVKKAIEHAMQTCRPNWSPHGLNRMNPFGLPRLSGNN